MGRLTEFFRAGFNEKQVNSLRTITSYPYIAPAGGGRVFYVDPLAAASGSGTTPETAFKTLAEGIAACTDARGDIILCLPGTETVTAPLTVGVGKLTIASVPHLGDMKSGALRYKIQNTDNEVVLSLTKQCQIFNIDVQVNNVAASAAAIAIATAAKGTVIDGCSFISAGSAIGVGITIDGATNGGNQIRNNTFSSLLKGIDFTHATDSIGDVIDGNTFLGCGDGAALTGGAIFWTNSSAATDIRNNTFEPCTTTGYPALQFNAKTPTGYCFVTNNTFVGADLSSCVYYNATTLTYAAWAALNVQFVGNKFQRSNTDVADGWNLTKSAEASLAPAASVNLFTVTGLVECKVYGQVTEALTTGAATTLVVGTAANTTAFANVVDAVTGSTIGDIIAGTSATTTAAAVSADTVVCAASTILATGHADYTAGKAFFYCMWRPLAAGSTVVTA